MAARRLQLFEHAKQAGHGSPEVRLIEAELRREPCLYTLHCRSQMNLRGLCHARPLPWRTLCQVFELSGG